jgi:hypothetical protein
LRPEGKQRYLPTGSPVDEIVLVGGGTHKVAVAAAVHKQDGRAVQEVVERSMPVVTVHIYPTIDPMLARIRAEEGAEVRELDTILIQNSTRVLLMG